MSRSQLLAMLAVVVAVVVLVSIFLGAGGPEIVDGETGVAAAGGDGGAAAPADRDVEPPAPAASEGGTD